MRQATSEELEYKDFNWKFKQYPWAAGKPGSMFDKPQDILYSRGETSPEGAAWLKANDISDGPFFHCSKWTTTSYLDFSGWFAGSMQRAAQITFYRDDPADLAYLMNQLAVIDPVYLPIVREITDLYGLLGNKKIRDYVLVGRQYQLFEPDLCEHGIIALFESGGTWLLTDNEYVKKVFASMDEALDYCKTTYSWLKVGESGRVRDEEDTW